MFGKNLCQFSRLKGFFRSGINYSNYSEILQNTSRRVSGNLPKDYISSLISRNPSAKREAITEVQKAFEQSANILGDIDKFERQSLNRLSIKGTSGMLAIIFEDSVKAPYHDAIFKDVELETVIKAEEKLLGGIKSYIPEAQNVVITPLGGGNFGNGFKIEVLGKDKKKILGDKVMKVYREKQFCQTIIEKEKQFLDSLTEEEAADYILEEMILMEKKLGTCEIPNSVQQYKHELDEVIECLKDDSVYSLHGATAEANISEYIKYLSGHKVNPEEGVAIPSLFGLGKTKFSISEFVGQNLKALKNFKFGRLGLQHTDLTTSPKNSINGICIDLGGIMKEDALLKSSLNKQMVKVIKSLSDAPVGKRKQMIEQYKSSKQYSNISDDMWEQIAKICE